LPPPAISTNDKFEAWELTQPFARTSMLAFRTQLVAAHLKSGNEGFVTREALVELFSTDAWKGLKN
jgi:hypothetical protein